MNKAELIAAVGAETGLSKTDAEKAINAVLSNIMKGVAKEPVQIVGFGTWRTVKTKPRTAMNPQTKQPIKVPAKKVIRFKASKNPKY